MPRVRAAELRSRLLPRYGPHSVRGFLSGAVGKKMGLTVESTKTESGDRHYSVKG
jgi:hypothetical protein